MFRPWRIFLGCLGWIQLFNNKNDFCFTNWCKVRIFDREQGCKQGDPTAPFLFIMYCIFLDGSPSSLQAALNVIKIFLNHCLA